MDDASNFHTSVDLETSALRYLRFLDRIHLRRRQLENHNDEKSHLIHNAIHRYAAYWLPLLNDTSVDSSELIPPWDIYYVWCLHILTSTTYRRFCMDKYGKVFAHKFHEHGTAEEKCRDKARTIWEAKYTDEPFEVSPEGGEGNAKPSAELVEVIMKSEEKHHSFYYQVSLPHYRNIKFLEDAKDRYFNLLLLKQRNPNSELWPTCDTEVMRQAHLLYPGHYEHELQAFFGEAIDFATFDCSFDVVTSYNHNEKGALETTRRLWNASFGTAYDIAGTRHRGNQNVSDKLSEPTHVHLKHTEPESLGIILDDILIKDVWSKDKQLSVEFRRLGQTSNSYSSLFRIPAKLDEKISTKKQTNQGRIDFNLKKNRGIELHIFGRTGRFCMKSETHVANVFLDPRTLYMEGEPIKSKEIYHSMPKISYGDPTVTFICKITVDNVAKPYVFSLDRDNFAASPIPTDLKDFIKLDSWTDLHLFHMDTFSTANHSIPLIGGGFNYRCTVTCCRDFDLGAVLLYEHGTDLLTAAHTIGDDQLPLPDQVSDRHVLSVEKMSGDHAMLIRNVLGDWGVCVMKPLHRHDSGAVKIIFENLQKHYTTETEFSFEDSTVLRIDGMVVDLFTGRVTLNPECLHTAEYVTLAYVVGILYVFSTGHKMLNEAEKSSLSNKETSRVIGGSSTMAKIKAKSNKQRYNVGASQSVKTSSSVTLSHLKSRRKKRSLFCTMLLACGLKSNMMVEEDLSGMSFHSEVSLIPDTDDVDSPRRRNRGMDDVHRHSFHQMLHETSKEISKSQKTFQDFLSPSSTSEEFSFGTTTKESARRKVSEAGLKPRHSVVHNAYNDYDNEEYEMPSFLNEGFLEERAQKLVQGILSGAIDKMENESESGSGGRSGGFTYPGVDAPGRSLSNGHAYPFISEGDDEAPKSIMTKDWERFNDPEEKVLEDTRL